MDTEPAAGFYRLLRTLDDGTFERFVVDLWRARGWHVEREGEALAVEHPTLGDRRRIAVHAVPWWRPQAAPPDRPDADLTVVNRPIEGAEESIVDAEELNDVLRYAVDPAGRAALLGEYARAPASLAGRAVRRAPARHRLRRVAAFGLLAAVLALAVAGLSVLPAAELTPDSLGAGGAAAPADAQFGTVRSAGPAGGGPEGAGTVNYPPGLSATGVTDPAAIAAAHAGAVAGRPRTVTLTVEKYEDSRRWGSYVERIAIRDADTFAVDVEARGDLDGVPPVASPVEVYADGGDSVVRPVRNVTRVRDDDPLPAHESADDVTARIQRFLERAFGIESQAIVETTTGRNGTRHRVTAEYDPGFSGDDERVSATVAPDGTVRRLHYERDLPVSDGFVVVTLEYAFGNPAVERPAWVGSVATDAD